MKSLTFSFETWEELVNDLVEINKKLTTEMGETEDKDEELPEPPKKKTKRGRPKKTKEEPEPTPEPEENTITLVDVKKALNTFARKNGLEDAMEKLRKYVPSGDPNDLEEDDFAPLIMALSGK